MFCLHGDLQQIDCSLAQSQQKATLSVKKLGWITASGKKRETRTLLRRYYNKGENITEEELLKHFNDTMLPTSPTEMRTLQPNPPVTCAYLFRKVKKTCQSRTGCYSSVVYDPRTGKHSESSYGCLEDNGDTTHLFTCGMDLNSVTDQERITRNKMLLHHYTGHPAFAKLCTSTICCRHNMCNQDLFDDLRKPCVEDYVEPIVQEIETKFPTQIVVSIAAPLLSTIFLLSILLIVYKLWKRKAMQRRPETINTQAAHLLNSNEHGESFKRLLDLSISSGSGAGLPFLVQRTVARQIVLHDLIGKGRYGEVWRGKWQNESVAVKIFNSRDEESWTRETQIYNTVMLRHNNILGYIASDITTRNEVTCMWLITHYHENGSLYDYLNSHTLDMSQMALISYSAINGLAHLHTKIGGMQGKPAIAHRDVKTKNILVKSNGECVISDLGLAVIHSEESKCLDASYNRRVGTKRYMAPELLSETMDLQSFDAYKHTDMYAFGLVLWEVARRTFVNGRVEECQPPYYDRLIQDPPFEEVKTVVVDDNYRPQIPNSWYNDEHLLKMAKLMTECWHVAPNSRVTATRVRKSLSKITVPNCGSNMTSLPLTSNIGNTLGPNTMSTFLKSATNSDSVFIV